MKLSVLDQSIWTLNREPDEAIRDTLALAEHTEALGYHRFWLSEHHSLPTIVGSAPEVLMAAVAARTRRIRIGSAGVMLPHYSALKVAEQFRVLDALAPGRIDLGVGRAPGGDMRTARALNPYVDGSAQHFPEQIRDLAAWVSGRTHQGITAHPRPPGAHAGRLSDPERAPDIWVLGSSDYGAQLAAHLGMPYAFAYFFMDGQGVERALELYRSTYQPSERHPKPLCTICVWALAADTDEEAEFHAASRERWRIDRQRGILGPLLTPEAAADRRYTPEEAAQAEAMRQRAFVGNPQAVGDKLRRLAASLDLDELVVNTWAHDPDVRRRSYSLLAREFQLT